MLNLTDDNCQFGVRDFRSLWSRSFLKKVSAVLLMIAKLFPHSLRKAERNTDVLGLAFEYSEGNLIQNNFFVAA